MIDDTLHINTEAKSVANFIHHNKFDYALITWGTSTAWFPEWYRFSGLVQQNKNWYLVNIAAPCMMRKGATYSNLFRYVRLNKQQKDSLLNILKPQYVFKYTQEDYDSLPEGCELVVNGEKRSTGIFDVDKDNVMLFSNHKVQHRIYYASEFHFYKCAPYNPIYKILESLVSTCRELNKVAQGKQENYNDAFSTYLN